MSIENPQNSLFWLTEPIVRLFSEHMGHHNVFQACMMGADRDKRTLWWCSDETFETFNILCDGMHSRLGFVQTFSLTQQAGRQTSAALQHVNMGFLARGNKLKLLVSEFAEYHTWLFRVDNNETEVTDILQSLPKGAKIVHRKLMKLDDVRVGEVEGEWCRTTRND